MKLKHFFLFWFVCSVPVVGLLYATRPASANLPSTRWGQQVEVGTVGNSKVYRVVDDTLTCLIVQPPNGTPAVTCWGAW